MIKRIRVGTAGFFRMRGLLFPTMTDATPDDTELFMAENIVIKTINKYFLVWKIDLTVDNLETSELESVIEVVLITLIISSNVQGQAAWLKHARKSLQGKSILNLILAKQYEKALVYSREQLW